LPLAARQRRAALADRRIEPLGQGGDEIAQRGMPDRGVRIVIGYPVGGGTDEMVRVIASALQRRIARPVVIENRPGAAGAAVGEVLKKAPTDGSASCQRRR
jgi:tripartite-type tricarboxylate transporter receptor subunit TctC